MLEVNGGEGNEEYAVRDFAPGLVIIGSDGGGTAYGYAYRNDRPKLVEVDFISMDLDSTWLNRMNTL